MQTVINSIRFNWRLRQIRCINLRVFIRILSTVSVGLLSAWGKHRNIAQRVFTAACKCVPWCYVQGAGTTRKVKEVVLHKLFRYVRVEGQAWEVELWPFFRWGVQTFADEEAAGVKMKKKEKKKKKVLHRQTFEPKIVAMVTSSVQFLMLFINCLDKNELSLRING